MYKSALLKLLTCLMLVLSFSGCTPTKPYLVSDIERDPQFVLIEMLATGLILGGVTSTALPLSIEERHAMTAALEEVLNKFSFYRFNTPTPLFRQLPPEQYEHLLDTFQNTRTIPVDELKNLESIYTPARYVLFVNIDANVVSQHKAFNPDSTDFQTIRTMVATLNIMSLQTLKPAILTQITFKDFNTNSVQRLRGGGGFLFGNIVAQVTFGGFPEPPPLERSLYKLFLAVADQVPSN